MGSVKSFTRGVSQSFLRVLFDHKTAGVIDFRQPNKILFDQKENLIGDMLVNTVAFREIKQHYPDWQVHILAGSDNREVVANNPNVDCIHVFDGLLSTARRLREERFDIYYYHRNRMRFRDYFLLNRVSATVNVGRHKEGYKLFDYSVSAKGGTEVDRYMALLALLRVEVEPTGYEYPINSRQLSGVKDWLSGFPGSPVIVFNRYGSPGGKLFSEERAIQLIQVIQATFEGALVVMLCPPAFETESRRIQAELAPSNVQIADFTRTITDSAAIIYHADLVVTPDTSVVHIACAYEKPQVCVYRDHGELDLWRPLSDRAVPLIPVSPSRDVNDVDVAEFKQALEKVKSQWL